MSDLLSRLKIEDHKVTSTDMISKLYDLEDDKKVMRGIEAEQYRKTIEYLEQNL